MKVIYKYQITEPTTFLELPEGATFLSAGQQNGAVVCWFTIPQERVNQKRDLLLYPIRLITTGEIFNDEQFHFLATVQLPFNPEIVVHLFTVV